MGDAQKIIRAIAKATGKPNQSAEIVRVGKRLLQVKVNPSEFASEEGLAAAILVTDDNPSVVNLSRLFPIVKTENFEGLALGNIASGTLMFEGSSSYNNVVGDHIVVNGLNGKALHHDVNEVQEDEYTPMFNASSFGLTNITAAKFKCLTNNTNEPVFEFVLGTHKISLIYQTTVKVKNGAAATVDTGVTVPTGNSIAELLLMPNIQQVTVDGVIVFQGTDSLLSATMIRAIFNGVGLLYDDMEITVLAGNP